MAGKAGVTKHGRTLLTTVDVLALLRHASPCFAALPVRLQAKIVLLNVLLCFCSMSYHVVSRVWRLFSRRLVCFEMS